MYRPMSSRQEAKGNSSSEKSHKSFVTVIGQRMFLGRLPAIKIAHDPSDMGPCLWVGEHHEIVRHATGRHATNALIRSLLYRFNSSRK
jgi:hypothetical protein